jgi:hypothetical protein
MARFAVVLSLTLLVSAFVFAQDPDPASGILPFSTQAAGTYDSVDLATGNINVNIPVRSKAGTTPFVFSLVGNSHAYIDGTAWAVSSRIGGTPFSGDLGDYVYATLSLPVQCGTKKESYWTLWSIVDATGAAHKLPNNTRLDYDGCYASSVTVTTTDGSKGHIGEVLGPR